MIKSIPLCITLWLAGSICGLSSENPFTPDSVEGNEVKRQTLKRSQPGSGNTSDPDEKEPTLSFQNATSVQGTISLTKPDEDTPEIVASISANNPNPLLNPHIYGDILGQSPEGSLSNFFRKPSSEDEVTLNLASRLGFTPPPS